MADSKFKSATATDRFPTLNKPKIGFLYGQAVDLILDYFSSPDRPLTKAISDNESDLTRSTVWSTRHTIFFGFGTGGAPVLGIPAVLLARVLTEPISMPDDSMLVFLGERCACLWLRSIMKQLLYLDAKVGDGLRSGNELGIGSLQFPNNVASKEVGNGIKSARRSRHKQTTTHPGS
jgi:hypothetical protein